MLSSLSLLSHTWNNNQTCQDFKAALGEEASAVYCVSSSDGSYGTVSIFEVLENN